MHPMMLERESVENVLLQHVMTVHFGVTKAE